jgi:hypothetical protein
MLRRCQIELERRRPAAQVPVSAVLAAMNRLASSPVLESVLSDMVAHRELVRRGDRIGLPGGAELSHRQRQTLDGFLAACADCGPAPPTVKEYSQLKGYPLQDLETLVQVAVDEGRLVRLTPAMVIDPGAIETLRQRLSDHFQTHPTAKVGELREQWGITRKHAVPIFEYFDQCQITQRAGDLRTAGPHIALPLAKVST